MSIIDNTHFVTGVRYIYDNIDQPLTLDNIAKTAGISVSSLKRIFEEAVEQSPGEFIRRMRMELAFKTLQSRHVSKILYRCKTNQKSLKMLWLIQ